MRLRLLSLDGFVVPLSLGSMTALRLRPGILASLWGEAGRRGRAFLVAKKSGTGALPPKKKLGKRDWLARHSPTLQ